MAFYGVGRLLFKHISRPEPDEKNRLIPSTNFEHSEMEIYRVRFNPQTPDCFNQ